MALNPVEACLRRSPIIKQINCNQLKLKKLICEEDSFQFTKNGKYVYHYDNDTIHVYLLRDGSYIGGHKFNAKIVSVGSLNHSEFLFIGLELPSGGGGVLSVFHSTLSIIVKSISLPRVPLQLEPLFITKSVGDDQSLNPKLLQFNGAIILACTDILYLLDLNITALTATSLVTDIELFNSISESSFMREDLHAADMTYAVKLDLHSETPAEVTSLNYSQRTSLLLIGMANGTMTFYCVKDMRPVWHHANSDHEFGSIQNIFIQEPENDPRKTCWVWQCAQNQDLVQLELYSLEFVRRDIFKISENSRRTQYSGLKQVVHRFSLARTGSLVDGFPLETWQKYSPSTWDDWCGSSPSTSMAAFAINEDRFRIILFDLNRYYFSRCPKSLGTQWDKNFMSIINISDFSPLSIQIPLNSIRLFDPGNCGGALLETDGYVINPIEPSSITFTVNSIIPEINGTYIESNEVLGLQENALCSLIDQGGVTSLCNPGLVHKRLELAGLTKNRMKKTDSEATMSIKDAILNLTDIKKRECILDSALRFGKLLKLRAAFEATTRNELIGSGVTIDHLQKWAIKRVFKLKKKLDLQVGQLFIDVCEKEIEKIRPDSHEKLFAIQNQLSHLNQVLHILTKDSKNEMAILVHQACSLNQKYVSILRWLIQRKILPEMTHITDNTEKLIWNFDALNSKYESRRKTLKKFSDDLFGKPNLKFGGLMIDLICDNIMELARKDWNYQTYPPPSLKNILDLFIARDLKSELTGSILYYALLDLIDSQNEDVTREIIAREFNTLGSIIKMDQNLTNYICACWYLDNGLGAEAVKIFLGSSCLRPISINHWKNILVILLSLNLEKDALLYLSIPLPVIKSVNDMDITITVKLIVYLANRKCRECWLLLRQVKSDIPWVNHFRLFVRSSIQNNLKKELLTLPLSSDEKGIIFDELRNYPQDQLELIKVFKVYHGANRNPSLEIKKDIRQKSNLILKEENVDLFSPLISKTIKNDAISQTKELFTSPSILKIREMRKEFISNRPNVCDSPSRSLIKIRNDENDSQNDEMGTRRSIRFLSESQTSQLSINDKTEVEEEKMDVDMESDTSVVTSNYDTRTEKSNDDISEQSSKIQKSEGAEQLLIIDSDEELDDKNSSQLLFDENEVSSSQDNSEKEEETGEILEYRPVTPDVELVQNEMSIYESPKGAQVESDPIPSNPSKPDPQEMESEELTTVVDESITPPEDFVFCEKGELLSNDTIELHSSDEIMEINDEQPIDISFEESCENIAELDPEELLSQLPILPYKSLISNFVKYSQAQPESFPDQLDQNGLLVIREQLSSILTQLVQKIRLDSQEVAAKIAEENNTTSESIVFATPYTDESDDSEATDAINGDGENTDTESLVPSVMLGDSNREIEFRKESPSSIRVIRRDIVREMGSEVAEAVSEEFICIDPRSSDNEVVIDEEPVVPENLYDGGSESEDDSVSSSIKPQPALGSPLSKDTSMDSERMTVSDAEEVNLDNEVNLKMAQKIQINLLGLDGIDSCTESIVEAKDEIEFNVENTDCESLPNVLLENGEICLSENCESEPFSDLTQFHAVSKPEIAGEKIENNEPEVVVIESEVSVNEPEVIEIDSEVVEIEPEVISSEPEVVSSEPEVVYSEPEVVYSEPEVVSSEPEVVEMESEMVEIEPEAVATEPEMVVIKPEMVVVEPEVVAVESEIVVIEPEVVTTEPEEVAIKPEVVEIKPEEVAIEPEVVAIEPEVVEIEQEVVAIEPEVIAIKPEVVAPEPEVVAPEPEVDEIEPEMEIIPNYGLKSKKKGQTITEFEKPLSKRTRNTSKADKSAKVDSDQNSEISQISRTELEELKQNLSNLKGPELKKLHLKYLERAFTAPITKTTKGMVCRRLTEKLDEIISQIPPELTALETVFEPETENEPESENEPEVQVEPEAIEAELEAEDVKKVSKKTRKPSNEPKQKIRPRRRSADNLVTEPTIIRRSARSRSKSGADSGSTSVPKSIPEVKPTLKPVAENEETLFSPPKVKTKGKKKVIEEDTVEEEIPNFHFTLPKNRKRSVDDLDEKFDSPAKKSKKTSKDSSEINTPVKSAKNVAAKIDTPVRRSSRLRK